MVSNTEIVQWVGFAFFGLGLILSYLAAMSAKLPTMKLKLLLVEVMLFSTAAVYGSMALGQGIEFRADGFFVNWERAVLYAATHGLLYAVVALSLDGNWGKASISWFLGTGQMSCLVFATRSPSDDTQLYWFIFALIILAVDAVFTLLWLVLPVVERPLVSNATSWTVKAVKILASILYTAVWFAISVEFSNAWPDTTGVMALYMVTDVIVKVFFVGLFVLRWVDLWEDGGAVLGGLSLKQGLPGLVGVHQSPCADGINNSQYQAANGFAAPPTGAVQMRLE